MPGKALSRPLAPAFQAVDAKDNVMEEVKGAASGSTG